MKLSPQGREIAEKMQSRLDEGVSLEDVSLEFVAPEDAVTFLTEMLRLENAGPGISNN